MQRLRFPSDTTGPLTPDEIIRSLSLLASPSSLCVHLNHYSVLDRDLNRFFSVLALPWKDTLRSVHIHGREHWLKAFLPGIRHVLYLGIEDTPYRPGTGLHVARAGDTECERGVQVWAEVFLAMTADAIEREGLERRKGREVGLTIWEVHCPGARREEILEAEKVLMGKLKVSIAKEVWETLERSAEPVIQFVTTERVACSVCNGKFVGRLRLIS
jgi:hypothetical protein